MRPHGGRPTGNAVVLGNPAFGQRSSGTHGAQALEVLLQAEDYSAVGTHRRKQTGRVEQAGVADGLLGD